MAKPPALTEEAKDYAVTCFAMFMRPTQVSDAVFERFGVRLDRAMMQGYDPTSVKGNNNLGKKRKQLFVEVRAKFLEEIADIPIANRAFRLKQLQLAYDKAVDSNNVRLATDLLEQASKEAGNFHASEKTVNVKHSGQIAVEEVSEDEMRVRLSEVLAATIEQARASPGTSTVQ